MRYSLALALLLSAAFSPVHSLSDGPTVLISFAGGGSNYAITIGDVIREVSNFIIYNPQYAGDAVWHKDSLVSRYVVRELYYLEQLAAGFTNAPGFESNVNAALRKDYYLALYRWGSGAAVKYVNAGLDAVRASHILFKVEEYTNIGGNSVRLPDGQISNLWKEKEDQAWAWILKMRKSTNARGVFSNAAVFLSDDTISGKFGGDLGWFLKGRMVKDFEDASFGAAGSGLVLRPVRTRYGWHLIFVTEPARKISLDALNGMADADYYGYLKGVFEETNVAVLKKTMISNLYLADGLKRCITVNGTEYTNPRDIPDGAIMVRISNREYDWLHIRQIMEIFVPRFYDTMSFDTTVYQLNNFSAFMAVADMARFAGYDVSDGFLKEMARKKLGLVESMAEENEVGAFRKKAELLVTPQAVSNYYQSMKGQYMRSVSLGTNGYTNVILGLDEVWKNVEDELRNNMLTGVYNGWLAEMKGKYHVVVSEKGLNALMDIERSILSNRIGK